jgi:hypothetical protein
MAHLVMLQKAKSRAPECVSQQMASNADAHGASLPLRAKNAGIAAAGWHWSRFIGMAGSGKVMPWQSQAPGTGVVAAASRCWQRPVRTRFCPLLHSCLTKAREQMEGQKT